MNKRRRLTGVVTSNKMQKTAVVEINRTFRHPLYKKVVHSRKRIYAHDELGCQLGDHVLLVESRPISRLKRWVVQEITRRDEAAGEPVLEEAILDPIFEETDSEAEMEEETVEAEVETEPEIEEETVEAEVETEPEIEDESVEAEVETEPETEVEEIDQPLEKDDSDDDSVDIVEELPDAEEDQ